MVLDLVSEHLVPVEGRLVLELPFEFRTESFEDVVQLEFEFQVVGFGAVVVKIKY